MKKKTLLKRRLPELDLTRFQVTAYQLAQTKLFSMGTAVELMNGERKNPTLLTLSLLAEAISQATDKKVRVRDLLKED